MKRGSKGAARMHVRCKHCHYAYWYVCAEGVDGTWYSMAICKCDYENLP